MDTRIHGYADQSPARAMIPIEEGILFDLARRRTGNRNGGLIPSCILTPRW
jgi:hypothetical protein